MDFTIRPLASDDIDTVVEFSLRAWAPVFASFERVLGADIYRKVYPDWLAGQAHEVDKVLRDEKATVWIAEVDGRAGGFAAVYLDRDAGSGEIEMLAVDPDYQGGGVGVGLTEYAVEQMRGAGIRLAQVATGGDPGHAPARRTYEKAGFTALPLVRYYRSLEPG